LLTDRALREIDGFGRATRVLEPGQRDKRVELIQGDAWAPTAAGRLHSH